MPSNVTEDMIMTNGMGPDKMTGPDRLDEVAMLLSLAMMRLWLKRRGGAHSAAAPERVISRGYSLGLGEQSLPLVTAGEP
jgi:hypothetical protein